MRQDHSADASAVEVAAHAPAVRRGERDALLRRWFHYVDTAGNKRPRRGVYPGMTAIEGPPDAAGGRRGRRLAAGVPLLVVLAFLWKIDGYHLPQSAQAAALNQGRTWELCTRLDAKGVPQVWVPPGCFEMGSDPLKDLRAKANETPRHTVCISAGFWLDQYEVTNESYQRFVDDGGYTDRRWWTDEAWRAHEDRHEPYRILDGFGHPRQAHTKVTWYEAEAYAKWRGGRLPTEAQWEWAARGPESRRFPWGDEFREDAANMDHLDLRHPQIVGSHPAGRSWCGAEDMAGNLWEWVADGYEEEAYRHARMIDPFTPAIGNFRVIRGGAWGGVPGGRVSDIRGARRAAWPADNRKLSHGLRVAHSS